MALAPSRGSVAPGDRQTAGREGASRLSAGIALQVKRDDFASMEVRLEDCAPAACAPQRMVNGGRPETAPLSAWLLDFAFRYLCGPHGDHCAAACVPQRPVLLKGRRVLGTA